jgi:hypothetical protein
VDKLRTHISDKLKRLKAKCDYKWMRGDNTYSLFEYDTNSNTDKKISTMTEFYNHLDYDVGDGSGGDKAVNGFSIVMNDIANELFYTESSDGWYGTCSILNNRDDARSYTHTCTGLENTIATVTTWIKKFI